MERRVRWNVRQVLAVSAETERIAAELGPKREEAAITPELLEQRLETIGTFFRALDSLLSSLPHEAPLPIGDSAPERRRSRESRSR